MPSVRAYRPSDLPALYDICVRTGAAGQDARGLYSDDRLLGDVYAAPYAALEPDFVFVLEADGDTLGYIVGTPDTEAFVQAFSISWAPGFAERYPEPGAEPDQGLLQSGRHPERMLDPALAAYPAHLHIDLLPEAQGRGFGRQLMARFLTAVHQAGAPAVHLGMDPANTGALAFYRRVGFEVLPVGEPHDLYLGRATTGPV